MKNRLDVEFAAVKILQEIFDERRDWSWMTIHIEGKVGMPRGGLEWSFYYSIRETDLNIRVEPPDDLGFMHIECKEFKFDLTVPTVFADLTRTIDEWISGQEKH